MDTGGKVATGILVPVGVGIVALVSYMIYENHRKKREKWVRVFGPDFTGAGGKRRTHRRRR